MKLLDISVTGVCNFACDYCIANKIFEPGLDRGKGCAEINGVVLDFEAALAKIDDYYADGWTYSVGGGEPTVVPGAILFINELAKRGLTIVMTNGSQLPHVYEYISKPNVMIRATWHPTMKKWSQFSWDIRDIRNIILHYVIHPRNLKSGVAGEHIECLEKSGIPYTKGAFSGVWDNSHYSRGDTLYEGLVDPISLEAPTEDMMATMDPDGRVKECWTSNTVFGNVRDGQLYGSLSRTPCFCPVIDPEKRGTDKDGQSIILPSYKVECPCMATAYSTKAVFDRLHAEGRFPHKKLKEIPGISPPEI